MDAAARQALVEYGRRIVHDGWTAGERVIRKNASKFKDFEKWARALGIMLRAREIFDGRVAK